MIENKLNLKRKSLKLMEANSTLSFLRFLMNMASLIESVTLVLMSKMALLKESAYTKIEVGPTLIANAFMPFTY